MPGRTGGLIRGKQTALLTMMLIGLVAMASLGGIARAHVATPEASPEVIVASCTENLGIVRSTKSCLDIIHASPDAPPVDIFLDGTKAVESLEFGDQTGFVEIPGAAHHFQIAVTERAPATVLIDLPEVNVAPGKAYELAIVGLAEKIETKLFETTTYAVPAVGDLPGARYRVINASPDAMSVDVALNAGDIATRAASNLAFSAAGNYSDVAAGRYRLAVSESATGVPRLYEPNVDLPPNAVTSFYIIGLVSDGSLAILSVSTAASRLPAPQ